MVFCGVVFAIQIIALDIFIKRLRGEPMSDKYLKEIAKELRLIRIELQKSNASTQIAVDGEKIAKEIQRDSALAGRRVTIG